MTDYLLLRTERLSAAIKAAGADAFIFLNDEDSNWESLFYMSGFRGTAGALAVFATGEAELILDPRYEAQGRAQSPHSVLPQKKSLTDELCDRIAAHGAVNVLCEAEKTCHQHWRALEAAGCLADGGELVKKLRRKKDQREIEHIKTAAHIGASAFLETLNFVRPGMKEKDFEALLNYKINTAGGETGFDMIVASGERSVMPHGRASEKPFAAGEWVTVDFGARYQGYFCDITRNFSLGSSASEAQEMHELIHTAHVEAAATLAPGAVGSEVHNIAAGIFEKAGKKEYFTHGTGHGFGLEIHEAPYLSLKKSSVLAPGDIVTVEPGLYIPGFGGMRIEDDYLITENGSERLTDELNQSFYSIPI